MKFKKLIILGLVAAVSLGLSGCGSKTTSGTTASSGGGTLYWWRSAEDANNETLQAIAKKYQDKTGIKINVVLKDPRTYEQDVVNALASNQTAADAPDIVSFKAEDLPKHILQLRSVPAKLFDVEISGGDTKKQTGKTSVQYAQSLFVDGASKAITFNNPATGQPDLYGLPMAIDTLVLYRNKDLIQKAVDNLNQKNQAEKSLTSEELKRRVSLVENAPATWQNLVEAIPYTRITNGNQITQAAIALGTSNNVERSYDILQSIMMQTGTKITSNDLDAATFNLSQSGIASSGSLGEKALNFYLQFANPSSPYYTWNSSMPDSIEAFKNGQTAMMIQYGSVYRYLINEAPKLKNSIDIAPLPQVSSPDNPTGSNNLKEMSRMWVETVPSARKSSDATKDDNRKKAAWLFVYYVTSKDGSADYLNAMQYSSALVDGKDNTRFPAFSNQKKTADTWFKGNEPLDVDKIFIKMIDDTQSGKRSQTDALNSAASEITNILQSSKIKWATAAARKALTTGGESDNIQGQ